MCEKACSRAGVRGSSVASLPLVEATVVVSGVFVATLVATAAIISMYSTGRQRRANHVSVSASK